MICLFCDSNNLTSIRFQPPSPWSFDLSSSAPNEAHKIEAINLHLIASLQPPVNNSDNIDDDDILCVRKFMCQTIHVSDSSCVRKFMCQKVMCQTVMCQTVMCQTVMCQTVQKSDNLCVRQSRSQTEHVPCR